MKRNYVRILSLTAAGVTLITLLGAYALACVFIYLEPALPSVEEMRKVELQVPLRVYTRSGELIAQIGEQRRTPVPFEEIPPIVRSAFLAAEDDRFFEHHGIDYAGVLRALVVNVISGDRAQGGSTISMQAARNMFLSPDKTWRRKLQEMFLTYRMERGFTKEEILGLYLNRIFFGQRAYGVAAAAETFFGKRLDDLTVAEAATLAGIAQRPSRYNPISNPRLATMRRSYVLRRMSELGFIDESTAAQAREEPMVAQGHGPMYDVEAPYIAEMARREVLERFGAGSIDAGYKVYTSIDGRLQAAANRAVRLGLIEYDRRQGWRGPLGHVDIAGKTRPEQFKPLLDEYSSTSLLVPAVVVSLQARSARVFVKTGEFAEIEWDGLSWAKRLARGSLGPEPKSAADVLNVGDVVHVVTDGSGVAHLAQVPEAQAALVALDPDDGAITALVGGFDYFTNKYNRVTQARRLPGSGFKPFLYSAALEDGFTPASVLLDAPIVLEGDDMETAWRPENYSRQFHGPTRLREALVRSRNLISIRLLRAMGTPYVIDYIGRFGFDRASLPRNLTLALGTLQTTPLEMASAYAVFANGGYRVEPYYIDRIENSLGEVIAAAEPKIVCRACEKPVLVSSGSALLGGSGGAIDGAVPVQGGSQYLPPERVAERVISPQNAWLLTDMLADVIQRGTGRRAMSLGRNDLAGKTGTTNDSKDAWFNGFNTDLVATVWVGFDQERSLGPGEEGARTALPVWVHFMREALRGVPERQREMPPGLVTLRISPDTGTLASGENPDAILETFMADHLPVDGLTGPGTAVGASSDTSSAAEPLF